MQEQEIATRATIKRRQKDDALPIKCRLCKGQEETVFHVLGSCPSLSSNLYTDHRHDKLGEIIVQEILRDDQVKRRWGPPAEVTKPSTKEICWNQHVHTANKKKYNRPDIVVWEKQRKLCTIVELSVPLDFKASSRRTSKWTSMSLLCLNCTKCTRIIRTRLYPSSQEHLGLSPSLYLNT